MDQTHLHLLITHLPIYGSILGAIVLAYGIFTKSQHTANAAYIVLIISSIGGFIAKQTGEAAEETVENIKGISEDLIHEHEESADIAIIAIIILGIISLAALFASYRKWSFHNSMGWIALLVSLITFGIVARTGYLGGQIRHTEINSAQAAPSGQPEESEE
ncbi:MAG: DUF2231 domain-containing protein [Bacteroidota bacterium]